MPKLPTLAESPSTRYITFFYLYVMQGIPSGFALTAIANYLVGQGLAPVTVGSFISIIGIPWIVQLVWGPLIDRFRYSVVGHYKHWIVLTQWFSTLASLSLLIVDNPVAQIWTLAALFFFHSIVSSIQDASVDAMAILITPAKERGRVNGFMRGGLLLGISLGAAALSIVLHNYGFRAAVLTQTACLAFFSILFFFTKLHRTDPLLPKLHASLTKLPLTTGPKLGDVFKDLKKAMLTSPSLRQFAIIGGSYICFSIFVRSLNFYLIRNLHWSDKDLSVLTGGWGSIFTLCIVFIGGYIADRWGPDSLQRKILLGLGIYLLLFNTLLLFISQSTFITAGILFWGIADPLYSIATFPILMRLCRKEVAGSQFTAYMSLINLCDIGGAYVSGWLLESLPGPGLGIASGVMIMLLFIALLRMNKGQVETQLATEIN